jgi:hypothetical protein
MFSVHATKKLLDRVRQPVVDPFIEPTTALGNWYATAIFWRPQVALFVNERTLLPVLVPLAPATTLLDRFPGALLEVLVAQEVDRRFVAAEVAESRHGSFAKTANRSLLGIMNEFTFLSGLMERDLGSGALLRISLELSETPCGPLYKSHGSPDRELKSLVEGWLDSP